ncbi:multiheme c-type cytochrome [Sulfurimonas sp.]|uniref:multiheme c-type cytochrome n=1 Tax=Sulfurimonas sp. TaxID=2022749 RepID=UPI003D0E4BAB
MRFFLVFLLAFSFSFGAKVVKVDQRYQESVKCKVCHHRIVDEWSDSWHAKSHYKNDEYFQKSIEYVSRKHRKSLNSVKVECATCHNPRISVTNTTLDYELAAVMGLTEGSKVDKAVSDDSLGEGINCVVCHNIDKIHDEYDATKRGIHRVEWTKSGTMTGPYTDAKSPYHKTIHHDFMDKNPNKLCFVCHANDRSVRGLVFTNMEEEYVGEQKCVECHMGPQKKDVAATYSFNGKAKIRTVRNHGFMGAHFDSMLNGALELSSEKKGRSLIITISNPQPHNVPSGFGGRELLLEMVYKNKSGEVIDTKTLSLTTTYERKKGREGIPHMAKKASKDMSIPAKGSKSFKVEKVAGAAMVEITLSYRLVNDEIRELLELKEPIWSKKYFVAKLRQKL